MSTLKQIPPELLEKVSTEPQMVRTIAFGLGVIQGMLVARQLFGAQGLNQWYPFNQVQMEQALVALTGKMLKSEEQQAPKVDNMVEIFAKVSLIFLALSNSKLSSNFMHVLMRLQYIVNLYRLNHH